MIRKKRGSGEGAIYQRKDGRWTASLSLEGRKRKTFYGKTRREVQEYLQEALHEYKQGLLVTSPQQPLKQYLLYWLEEVHKAGIRPRSYERYEQIIRLHLLPTLGAIPVQKLSPQRVQKLSPQRVQKLSPQRVQQLMPEGRIQPPSSIFITCCIKPSTMRCAGDWWHAMCVISSRPHAKSVERCKR